ncbi:hypothetical protein [Streptomyces sp. NBC_01601]|uniref:hypothetical protein n=1 Tax=Streptomyces sp. NBC_01601 TaxID=2975892 RepID=UPI002E2A0F0E|nr:hypothetical protein [Streptomyces sp. NBC_01601]
MTDVTELAVHVVRPDSGATRIGPIPAKATADDLVESFRSFSTRLERQGVTCAIAAYDPDQEHLPLLPAEPARIAALIDHPVQGLDAPYPNLWDRLVAQHGLGTTDRVWRAAMAYRCTDDEATTLHAPQSSADTRFDSGLRLTLSALARGDQDVETAMRDIRRLAATWAAHQPTGSPVADTSGSIPEANVQG